MISEKDDEEFSGGGMGVRAGPKFLLLLRKLNQREIVALVEVPVVAAGGWRGVC